MHPKSCSHPHANQAASNMDETKTSTRSSAPDQGVQVRDRAMSTMLNVLGSMGSVMEVFDAGSTSYVRSQMITRNGIPFILHARPIYCIPDNPAQYVRDLTWERSNNIDLMYDQPNTHPYAYTQPKKKKEASTSQVNGEQKEYKQRSC